MPASTRIPEVLERYEAEILAEWMQSGTWIDVHISAANAKSIDNVRLAAMDVLKSIRVTETP